MDNFVIRKNTKPLSNNKTINVYTDGACTNNGKPDARAGFGIWFGDNDERKKDEQAGEQLFGEENSDAQAVEDNSNAVNEVILIKSGVKIEFKVDEEGDWEKATVIGEPERSQAIITAGTMSRKRQMVKK